MQDNNFSFANAFNASTTFFDVDTTGLQFVSLQWLHTNYNGCIFAVKGLFVNHKGNFGDTPVIISDGALVNLPSHCMATTDIILHQEQAVNAIKSGKVGFKVREFVSKNPKAKGKKCYTIHYVDLTPDMATTVIDVPEK